MTFHRRDEVPSWSHFPHIETGYRVSSEATFKSIFQVHNEFMNIWTMILINIISLILLIWSTFQFPFNIVRFTAFLTFYISSLIHLPFSVLFHLYLPRSQKTFNYLRKLDMIFIFIGALILTFALCLLALPYTYTFIIVTISLICSVFVMIIVTNAHKYSNLDYAEFVGLITLVVCLFITPMAYQSIVSGMTIIRFQTIVTILALSFGAYVYLDKFPEKYYPEKFDLYMNSHNIMHFCLLIAHVMEFSFIYTLATGWV